MSEIEYTVAQRTHQIQTTITAAQRGARASGSTGCTGETSRCGHFRADPTATPDNPSVDFTGRYEWDGSSAAPPCTVQMNQAGDYVYGWFQIDNYQSTGRGGTVLRNAVTEIADKITLAGINDKHNDSPDEVESTLKNTLKAVKKTDFTVLLSHQPDVFNSAVLDFVGRYSRYEIKM